MEKGIVICYNAKTYFGAFYLQDKISFEGMTLNVGLRSDYWIPGRYVESAINDTSNQETRPHMKNLDLTGEDYVKVTLSPETLK